MGHGGRNNHTHYDNEAFDDRDRASSVSRGQRRLARHELMDYSRTLDSSRLHGQFGLTRDWEYNDSNSRLSFLDAARSASYNDYDPYRMPHSNMSNDPRMIQQWRGQNPSHHKKKTSADLLDKFAEQTTLQGVIFIKNSTRWWSTGFWVLCFLGAFAVSLYQLVLIFEDYYERPYSTVIKLDYAFLPFPSVTVCNMNPVRTSLLPNSSEELQAFFEKYNPENKSGGSGSTGTNTGGPGPNTGGSGSTGTNTGGPGPNTGGSGSTGTNTGGPGPNTDGSGSTGTDTRGPGTNTDGSGSTGTNIGDPGPNTGGSGSTGTNTGDPGPNTDGSGSSGTNTGGSGPNTGGSGSTGTNTGRSGTNPAGSGPGSLNPGLGGRGGSEGPGGRTGPSRFKRQLRRRPALGQLGPHGRNQGQPDPTRQKFSDTVSASFTAVDDFLDVYGNLSMEERETLGVPIDSLVLECSFNGYECSTSNFTHNLSPRYGNCYTFNDVSEDVQTSFQSFQGGRLYGLQLTMMVDTIEYPPGGIAEGVGIAVSIHPFNTLSFPEVNSLMVSAGNIYSISMRMNNITRLGLPYSNCTSRNLTNFVNDYGHYYTKEACLVTCYYESLVSRCQCTNAPYEVYHRPADLTKYPQCSYADKACITEVNEDVRNGRISGCNDCLPACIEESYDIQISSSIWPDASLSEYYSQKLVAANNRYKALYEEALMTGNIMEISEAIVSSNILKLNIHYRDLNFQQIDEKADYGTAAFASDIGGTLGLWLGVSAVTGVELLQLLTQLLWNCCRNRAR